MISMYPQERVKDILSRVPLNPLSPCVFSFHSDILQLTVCMPGFSSLKLVKCKLLIVPCLMRMLSLVVMLFSVIKVLDLEIFC